MAKAKKPLFQFKSINLMNGVVMAALVIGLPVIIYANMFLRTSDVGKETQASKNNPPKITYINADPILEKGIWKLKLAAFAQDQEGQNIQVAFRIRESGNCESSITSVGPWTEMADDGYWTSSFDVKPGRSYEYTAKAKDSIGFSVGEEFCGSTGWFNPKEICINCR